MNVSRNELAAVTARAKRRFPDHTLDNVYPICVPIYELRLLVTSLAEDTLSTSARFILRLVNVGVAQPIDIGRILGLSASYVAGAASELLGKELVVQALDGSLRITDAGKKCLQDGGSTLRPRNLSLRVPYDPLTKRVLDIDPETLLDREVVRKNGMFVIPVDPRPPRLNSIRVEEVRESVRGDPRFQGSREILQVSDIKNHKLRYLSDVVMVKMDTRQAQSSTFAVYRALQYLEEESAEVQRLADLGRDLVPEEAKKATSHPWASSLTISDEERVLLFNIDELDVAVEEKNWKTEEAREAHGTTQNPRGACRTPDLH